MFTMISHMGKIDGEKKKTKTKERKLEDVMNTAFTYHQKATTPRLWIERSLRTLPRSTSGTQVWD
jgi:hypothetical protein